MKDGFFSVSIGAIFSKKINSEREYWSIVTIYKFNWTLVDFGKQNPYYITKLQVVII